MVRKLLGLAAHLGEALLPAATRGVQFALNTGIRLTEKLGALGLSAVKTSAKKRGKRSVTKKLRRVLRITALVSGTVTALSCAALIRSHRK